MQYELTEHELIVSMVRIDGRIDASTAPRLKETFKSMTRADKCNIVIDLRSVEFIDSTGLGMFTSVLRAARANGGDVCLVVKPGSAVDNILAIVRFEKVLELRETPELALNYFRF